MADQQWSDDADDTLDGMDDDVLFALDVDIDDYCDEARPARAMTAKQRLEEIMEERALRSNIANWDEWDTLLANN